MRLNRSALRMKIKKIRGPQIRKPKPPSFKRIKGPRVNLPHVRKLGGYEQKKMAEQGFENFK